MMMRLMEATKEIGFELESVELKPREQGLYIHRV